MLVSIETVDELNAVLQRPKFNAYLTEEQRLEFLVALLQETELISVTDVVDICRDPADNKLLALAVSGNATHLITGDADLLVLHPFQSVAILTAQQFLAKAASP